MNNLIIRYDEDGSTTVCSNDDSELCSNLRNQYRAWKASPPHSSQEAHLWNEVLSVAEQILEDEEADFSEVTDVYEDDETAPSPAASGQSKELPPDPEGMNDQRSMRVDDAITLFSKENGEDIEPGMDADTIRGVEAQNLTDMLADIGHFCDRHHLDLQDVLRMAKSHYDEETDNEGTQFTTSN